MAYKYTNDTAGGWDHWDTWPEAAATFGSTERNGANLVIGAETTREAKPPEKDRSEWLSVCTRVFQTEVWAFRCE